MGKWKKSIKKVPTQGLFQGLLVVIFLLPLIATIGQYSNSEFLSQKANVLILFWPGVDWKWYLNVPGWAVLSTITITYLSGIVYLVYKRNFGKVALWALLVMIVANLLGGFVNNLFGWKEQHVTPNLAGVVNRAILGSWHNPLWEEIVFRGIPLLVLLITIKKFPQISKITKWMYILLPSIIFAIYHLPNHGPSRLVDTFILGCVFAWMTLEYSFYAPLVLHYIFDAMQIIFIAKLPKIPYSEAKWLIDNSSLINNIWSFSWLSLILSALILIFWNRLRFYKVTAENKSVRIL